MTIDIDEMTRKRLILARELYERAVLLSQSTNPRDLIIAVIQLDLAVETTAKSVTMALDPSKRTAIKDKTGIDAHWQQADKALQDAGLPVLPEKAHTWALHGVRNDAQHDARVPSASTVMECRVHAHDFLRETVSNVWGKDFDQICLADLIQSNGVKSLLIKAQVALTSEDFTTATQLAAQSLTTAMSIVRDLSVGRAAPNLEHWAKGANIAGDRWTLPETMKILQRLQDELFLLVAGIDKNGYAKYLGIVGYISQSANGIWHYGIKEPVSAMDAEFVVSYAIKYSIRNGAAPWESLSWEHI